MTTTIKLTIEDDGMGMEVKGDNDTDGFRLDMFAKALMSMMYCLGAGANEDDAQKIAGLMANLYFGAFIFQRVKGHEEVAVGLTLRYFSDQIEEIVSKIGIPISERNKTRKKPAKFDPSSFLKPSKPPKFSEN